MEDEDQEDESYAYGVDEYYVGGESKKKKKAPKKKKEKKKCKRTAPKKEEEEVKSTATEESIRFLRLVNESLSPGPGTV